MVLQFDMGARWRGFLEEVCHEAITTLAHEWPKTQSLEVRYGDLQAYDPDFAASILQSSNPFKEANEVLQSLMQALESAEMEATVSLIELPRDHTYSLREIRNKHIDPLIAIEGVVSKITSVRPMITNAIFLCKCGHETYIQQDDETRLTTPVICEEHEGGCGREARSTRFKILHTESTHLDTQSIEIQELPEKVKSGQAPEIMRCLFQGFLAGVLSPGNRVVLNGNLHRRAQRKGGKDTPVFDLVFKCHSLERKNIPLEEVEVNDEEKEMILNYSKRDDLDNLLSRSIAPSIFGYLPIKRSLVLQLFGGVTRINSDSTRARGDIHILLMGDPGVAKSQLLNYMVSLAPRGQFASGMSSSGAGLTAAAVQHPDGGWTVEAGALPLADMGLAAVDEFDKMGEQDRSAMHEAMEQQKISIHKATVHTTMRTRCAILAAANPVDGKFIPPELDKKMRPYTQQITLAKPLLTRFDCIWTMLDRPEKEGDRRIGSHIASYRQAGTPEWLIDEGIEAMPSSSDAARGTVDGSEIIEPEIFQKYVAYAKKNFHPKVTDTAREKIVEYYVQARLEGGGINESGSTYTDGLKSGMEIQSDSLTSVPISARSIESLIRLAEARARTRLSNEATIEDAAMAIATFDTWRYELMGDSFDETSMASGKTTTKRNIEHKVLSFIIQKYNLTDNAVELHEILSAMEKFRISKDQVDDILDVLCNNGTLFRPASNRNEYQPV